MSRDDVREELQATLEARKELGADLEPSLIDGFLERVEKRLNERGGETELSLERRRKHQRELIVNSMGISIPLFVVAAIFTGLPGVVAVCAMLAVIAIAAARAR